MNASNALFQEHIQRSIHHVIRRISQAEAPVERDLRLAQHVLAYALDVLQIWPSTRTLLLLMAPPMELTGKNRDDWISFLEKVISISQQVEDREAEAELSLLVGRIYQLRSKLDAARTFFEASSRIFESLGHNSGLAKSLNREAFVCCLTEQFEKAISLSQRALALLADDDFERAAHYNVLGRVAYLNREWATAAGYYQKALCIRERQENKRLVAYNLRDLSAVLGEQGELEEAIHCCQKAISLLGEAQDPIQQATCRINLGALYLQSNQPIKAVACFEFVKPLFQKIKDDLNLAIVYTNLGVAHRSLREWLPAERSLRTAIEYWKRLNQGFFLLNAWGELGLTQMQQGLYQEAIITLESALQMASDLKENPNLIHKRDELTMYLADARKGLAGSS